MLGKLAVRNVKRQAVSYIIYFITVVLAVALMFAINNILYSKELENIMKEFKNSTPTLIFFIALVTLVVGFIIAYATAFLLRKRKKEFGTYMLLGIKRSAVLKLFITENLIVGAVSFVTGSLLGVGVFQVLNAVVCAIMGHNFGPLKMASGSFWLTFLLWAGIFSVAILYSAIILMRSKISDLLKVNVARKKPLKRTTKWIAALILLVLIAAIAATLVYFFLEIFGVVPKGPVAAISNENTVGVIYMCIPPLGIFAIAFLAVYIPKTPKVEKVLAIMTLGLLVASCIFELWIFSEFVDFWERTDKIFESFSDLYFAMFTAGVALIFSSIFLFHIFSRSFYLSRLEGNKKLHGSNSFHFRQMASALNRNTAIMGTIALLLSISFFFSNFAFSMRYMEIDSINSYMPFDVIGTWSLSPMPEEGERVNTPEEVIAKIQEYSPITLRHEYGFYNGEYLINGEVHEYTRAMKQSGLNPLLKYLNKPQINGLAADEFYLIVTYDESIAENQLSRNPYEILKEGDTINIFGKELTYKGIQFGNIPHRVINYDYFIVVADEALTDSEWEENLQTTVIAMNTRDYLPQEFYYAFAYLRHGDDWRTKVECKYFDLDNINAGSSILIASALYLGIAFMFIAMALLSLKVMSEADLDKRRYSILNMLGVNERWQRKILFRQIFTFFAAPMFIPFFMAIPSVFFTALFSMSYIGSIPAAIYTIGVVVPLICAGIYACYFAATYYLSVKNNIKPLENPKIRLLRGKK